MRWAIDSIFNGFPVFFEVFSASSTAHKHNVHSLCANTPKSPTKAGRLNSKRVGTLRANSAKERTAVLSGPDDRGANAVRRRSSSCVSSLSSRSTAAGMGGGGFSGQ